MNKMIFMKAYRKSILFVLLLCVGFSGIRFGNAMDHSSVMVHVDHRMELLYIIQATANASSYHNCQLMNTVYHQEVIKYFRSFRDHEAVVYYKQHMERQFDIGYLEEVFLSLPTYMQEEDIEWKEHWPVEVCNFVEQSIAFYFDSSFRSFMNRQHSIIQQMESIFQRNISRQSWLEDYMGWFSSSVDTMHIVLSPLKRSSHTFYYPIKHNEEIRIYIVLGLTAISNGFLVFAPESVLRELTIYHGSQLLLREGLSLQRQLLDEVATMLDSHLKEMNLPYDSAEEYISNQLGISFYWIVIQRLDESFSLSNEIEEKRSLGYVFIADIYQLAQEFVFQDSEQGDWKIYAPVFLTKLIKMIPEHSAQESIEVGPGSSI
jgi:hypothetical protein